MAVVDYDFGAVFVVGYGSVFVVGSDSVFVVGSDVEFVVGSGVEFVVGSDSMLVVGSDSVLAFGSVVVLVFGFDLAFVVGSGFVDLLLVLDYTPLNIVSLKHYQFCIYLGLPFLHDELWGNVTLSVPVHLLVSCTNHIS